MLDDLIGQDVNRVGLAVAVVAAVGLACLFAALAARAVRALLLSTSTGDADSPAMRRPIQVTRVAVFVAGLLTVLPPVLELAGLEVSVGLELSALTGWLLGPGLRIVVIALLAYLLVRMVAFGVKRLEVEISHDATAVDASERAKRGRTLSRLIQSVVTVMLVAVAALMVLRELGVDIMPILTGAGILGLAVGFGAQTLVKDLIAGFFMILENHIRVGDVAVINGTGGLVEAINLRTVVIRDLEGVVHVFPSGSIETLANRTKDFSFYVVEVGVAYKEDTDAVTEVLREVGAELAADPAFQPWVLEPLEILGVDAFEDSQVTIKIRIKTVPLKQWVVGRELRRRIKMAFDAKRIEIPFPHVSVYFGEASQPFHFQQAG